MGLFRRRSTSGRPGIAGVHVYETQKLKALDDQNRHLTKLLAESMLDNAVLTDLTGKH